MAGCHVKSIPAFEFRPDISVCLCLFSDAEHVDLKMTGNQNDDAECEEDAKGAPMNWGDNALGASTLLAKRLIRSISGPDFDLIIYAVGALLVVVDARTAQRCACIYFTQMLTRAQARGLSPHHEGADINFPTYVYEMYLESPPKLAG